MDGIYAVLVILADSATDLSALQRPNLFEKVLEIICRKFFVNEALQ